MDQNDLREDPSVVDSCLDIVLMHACCLVDKHSMNNTDLGSALTTSYSVVRPLITNHSHSIVPKLAFMDVCRV